LVEFAKSDECGAMSPDTIQDSGSRVGAIRWLLSETLSNLVLIAILFGAAGRWDWAMGWALSGIYVVSSGLAAVLFLSVNPAMLAERARPHPGTKAWDWALLAGLNLLTIGTCFVGGLNIRLGWAPHVPTGLEFVGLAAAALGYDVLLTWAMASNAFFVATVRIQTDRHHAVATDGPYRYIRHPGYLGGLLLRLGMPFMLGSVWALVPAGLSAVVLVVRTVLEDKTLHAELPGYREYAERVRYRLLPGVW
jgi:protein-S-isoprenylcysteine O-methyltransferase Ste14